MKSIETGRIGIRKAVAYYKECLGTIEEVNAGIQLVLTARNGIENLAGISCEQLYNDREAFSRLLQLAKTV